LDALVTTQTHDPFTSALREQLRVAAGSVEDSGAFIAEATGHGRLRLRRQQRRTRWGIGALAALLVTGGAVGGVRLLDPAPLGLSVAGPVLGQSEPTPTPLKTDQGGAVEIEPSVTAAAADTIGTVVQTHLPGWSAAGSAQGWRTPDTTTLIWEATTTATSPAVTLGIDVDRDATPKDLSGLEVICEDTVSCSQQTMADGSVLTVGTRGTLVQLGSMPAPARPVQPFAALYFPDGRTIGANGSIAAPDIPVDSAYPKDSEITTEALRAIVTDPRLQALTIPAPQ
jgi:hypothetical protein